MGANETSDHNPSEDDDQGEGYVRLDEDQEGYARLEYDTYDIVIPEEYSEMFDRFLEWYEDPKEEIRWYTKSDSDEVQARQFTVSEVVDDSPIGKAFIWWMMCKSGFRLRELQSLLRGWMHVRR